MSVWINLLLWVFALPLTPILYFMLKNECKPKKNILVGVTLPYQAQYDPEVLGLLERYKIELKRICWAALLPIIPCLFIRSTGASMTAWFIWIFVFCIAIYTPYIRCNRALHQLKEARGWMREENRQVVTDLKAAAESMRWLSPAWFLPPFLISLLPLIFDRTMWWLWVIDAALTPLFYACYRWLYRNRAEVVDTDSDLTRALTRIRRYNWGKCWIVLAWATGAFNVGMWLTWEHFWACTAVVLVYGIVVVGAVVSVEFRVRRLQEKLTVDSGRGFYVDDDDHWICGIFYYNPNDGRLMVNARVGIGTTINLARRAGRVIMALVVVLVLACLLIGPGTERHLTQIEEAPVELMIMETEIVGSHYHSAYSVALEKIKSIELLNDLPAIRRVSGTSMETVKAGSWSSDEWGRFTCCIDPRMGPWLLIETEDGEIYLFGSSSEGAAQAAAAALKSKT